MKKNAIIMRQGIARMKDEFVMDLHQNEVDLQVQREEGEEPRHLNMAIEVPLHVKCEGKKKKMKEGEHWRKKLQGRNKLKLMAGKALICSLNTLPARR